MMVNNDNELSEDVGQVLVAIARRSLEAFVRNRSFYLPNLAELPTAVTRPGCTFVTLTNQGALRGCIGCTEPRWPLAEDAARNAVAAASRDPRFVPVEPAELDDIRLEVTVLTQPQTVAYADYDDLLHQLRVGIDGVIVAWGVHRGVLLPQVWDRIPDKNQFLTILAHKAGIPAAKLRHIPPTVVVQTFQAQHFAEPGYREPGD